MNVIDKGANLPHYTTVNAARYADTNAMVAASEYWERYGTRTVIAGAGAVALGGALKRSSSQPNLLPKVSSGAIIAGAIFIVEGVAALIHSDTLQASAGRIDWALERGAAEIGPETVEIT